MANLDHLFNFHIKFETRYTPTNSGNNDHGRLSQADTNDRGDEQNEMGDNLFVIDFGSDFEVEQFSCGGGHTCALSTMNEIKCFGRNEYGQLGYEHIQSVGHQAGEMGDNLAVVQLGSDFVPIDVECGFAHSCALSTTAEAKCWGLNDAGQLGQGDTNYRGDGIGEMGDNLSVIDLGPGFNVSSIHCATRHVCVISTAHEMKCWGFNCCAQLGLGDTYDRGNAADEMGDDLPLVDLGDDFDTQIVGGGRAHHLAISTDGNLKGFGQNTDGKLGYEDTNARGNVANEMGDFLALIDVGIGYSVVEVSSGCYSQHSCALIENGTDFLGLKCWGLNANGQLGLGDNVTRGDAEYEMADYLSFVSVSFPPLPTQSPTLEPTVDPTLYPSKIPSTATFTPSDSPSITPSNAPSREPTLEPTDDPSPVPTTEPTLNASRYTLCTLINLDIIDFDAFTANDLDEDSELQSEIADITKDAIAESAFSQDKSLEFNSFVVAHRNVSGDVSNVDGVQRSLFIVQRLCTVSSDDLEALEIIIETENGDITTFIANQLITLYLNGDSSDSFKVNIIINKFGFSSFHSF